MKPKTVRALVYGDADLNVIDGSSVWVQGAVQVLVAAGCEVTLILKTPVANEKLLGPLLTTKGVTIRRPFEEKLVSKSVRKGRQLTQAQATQVIRDLDRSEPFDFFLIRGLRMVGSLVADGSFTNRLWTYLTDIPQAITAMTPEIHQDLVKIVKASRYLLCQTEELRSLLETLLPESCGRTALLPPVVPEPDFELPAKQPPEPGEPVKLVYMGKYAPDWNTLEMTELPAILAARGQSVEVHMVGDKIHRVPETPEYAINMRNALTDTPGVVWHGGVSRQQAWRIASNCHVSLSWRNGNLDESLELSTKLLEYGRLGLPVVLNRTPMHEALLGGDYPLFVDGANVADVISIATNDAGVREVAAKRCAEAARPHSLLAVAESIRAQIASTFPMVPELAERRKPLRVLVASHDLKFFTQIQDYLASLPGIELRVDFWEALNKHDKKVSARLNDWADVVICEWCGPNAAWYSRNKRPGQRLIVRLHRFELFGKYPSRVAINAVDQVICVSPHYAALTRERTNWPASKIAVIPNWVDLRQLDRPKLRDSQFTLGFIGVAPIARKRLDRALDILADLRKRDRRFQLAIKTKMPWEYPWIWADPEERELTNAALHRIRHDPDLRNSVTFDSFGSDVGNWLRRIGFVLSTSDDESFHLAPAEGMASGAVPVIINWPGAETIYNERWIHDSTESMADSIYDAVVSGDWQKLGAEAQEEARSGFGLDVVCREWTSLLSRNIEPPVASAAVTSATGVPTGAAA